MKLRWAELLRDLFLGGLATAILYQEVWVAPEAQPILIFLVIFLYGCIPFLRGDKRKQGEYSPFVRLVMMFMGVKLPQNFKEADEDDDPEGHE